jgi:hypothetical protein
MHNITAKIQERSSLDPVTRADMFALLSRYYDGVSRQLFDSDLDAKDSVVVLREDNGRLCGFSTLVSFPFQHDGHSLKIVYSGDTIIEREHWGSHALAFAWIRHMGKLARQASGMPLYWLLTVKGHRTYRYLPAFGLRFAPDWRAPQNPSLIRLRNTVAAERFGAAFDPETGIVSHAQTRGHLAIPYAGATERERRRADVQFFLKSNPGYRSGDELVCLCELAPDNMRPLTRRLFENEFRA